MGMPMYGQSFTLADANENGLNAKSMAQARLENLQEQEVSWLITR
jgi:hypothetical protein